MCSLARAQPHELQAILVEHEMDCWGALTPVLVHLAGMGVGAHDGLDLVGNGPQLIGVGAHDTEVDQVTGIGAEDELGDPHASLRHQSLGDPLA